MKVLYYVTLVVLLLIALSSSVVEASCLVDSDCTSAFGDKHTCKFDDDTDNDNDNSTDTAAVGFCWCSTPTYYEANGMNSMRNTPDADRTCHHLAGQGIRGYFWFTRILLLVCSTCLIVAGIMALLALKAQRKLGVNVQTMGLAGPIWYGVVTMFLWSVDPLLENGFFSQGSWYFFYYLGDMGTLAAQNVFFLFWRDLAQGGLMQAAQNRFIKGKGVQYAATATIIFMLIMLSVSALIFSDSTAFIGVYILYNIGFLIYMIRFRYKLNKKIAELGTSMGGKNNAATDKMRKKLNMIAIFLIAVSCSTLTIIMVAVFFLREADETLYWTIQTIGRVVGVGLGVVLLRAFWPRNAIKHAKTTIRGNTRVEPAGSTKVLGTPATPSRGGGLQPASKSVANRAASPDPAQRSDIAVSLRSGSPVQRPKETVLQIPAA